ncbi:hypothetical protein JXR93_03600 [bacterium]|nr:hypothetical protein [bacterium]
MNIFKSIIFLILSFLITNSLYSFPFVKNREGIYFENSSFGYSTPSFFYLNIDEIDYSNLSLGYFWYNNWYVSSGEITILGNNLAPWKDGDSNIDSTLLNIAEIGYYFDNKYIDFFISFGGGIIKIYDTKYLDDTISQTKKGLFSIINVSLGFLINWRSLTFKIAASGGTTGEFEGISKFIFDLNYHVFNNWKIGFLAESAGRSFEICTGDESSCKFEFTLIQSSLYISYNFYKNYWILTGFVIDSNIEKTVGDNTITEPQKIMIPIYISID